MRASRDWRSGADYQCMVVCAHCPRKPSTVYLAELMAYLGPEGDGAGGVGLEAAGAALCESESLSSMRS